jgi:hypothetical protein
MADYFREPSPTNANGIDYTSQNLMVAPIQEENDDTRASSPLLAGQPEEDQLPPEIKERLVDRLEQEILGNLDVNFLFNKGEKLRHGLIDQNRLYKIMLKIKEIAQKQIKERGSRQIDYTAIVKYLEEVDQFQTKGEQSEFLKKQNVKLQ